MCIASGIFLWLGWSLLAAAGFFYGAAAIEAGAVALGVALYGGGVAGLIIGSSFTVITPGMGHGEMGSAPEEET